MAGTRPLLSDELMDYTPVGFKDPSKKLQILEGKYPRIEFSMSFDPIFTPQGYRFYSGFFRDMNRSGNEITAPFVYNKMDIRYIESQKSLFFERKTDLLRLKLVLSNDAKPILKQVFVERCADSDADTTRVISVTRSGFTRKQIEDKLPGKFALLKLYSTHGKEGMTRNPTLIIEEAMGFPLDPRTEKPVAKAYSDWYFPLWMSIVEGEEAFNDNCRSYETIDQF